VSIDNKTRFIPSCFLWVILFTNFTSSAQVNNGGQLANDIIELEKISTELKKNILPLLTLIKEFEKSNQFTTLEIVKAVQPDVNVMEADNPSSTTIYTAQPDEEFELLEYQEPWLKIKLKDGREGWVSEDRVQIIEKQELAGGFLTSNRKKNEAGTLLAQMAAFENRTGELFTIAGALQTKIENHYQKLSDARKTLYADAYSRYQNSKSIIGKYQTYVEKYYQPYRHLTELTGILPGYITKVKKFSGDASVNFGQSKYSGIADYSTTSRDLALNGAYKIDDKTSVNASFNNQSEIIQSPFTTTSMGAGFNSSAIKNLKINAGIGHSIYSDKTSEENSFSNTSGRVNLSYQVHQKASLFGNLNLMNKKFELEDGNDYNGKGIVIGTLINPNTQNHLRLQFRGNSQKSEIDYLSFNQLNPQLYFSSKSSPQKTFSTLIDFNKLIYEESNNQNDFQKLKLNLNWKNRGYKKLSNRSFIVTGKQFPNDSSRNYVRAGIQTRSQKGSIKLGKTINTAFTSNYTYFIDRDSASMNDFLDLRINRSATRQRIYFTISFSTRIWNNFLDLELTGPDHVFDLYTEIGPIINDLSGGFVAIKSIKPGIILGGHGLVNIDEDHVFRNGNSARGGLSLQSNIGIHKGSLVLAAGYERSFIISTGLASETTEEEITLRMPYSYRFKLDFRYPIVNNWDINFRVFSYKITTDANESTIHSPLESRSNTRFSGGFIYRFSM